MIVSPYLGGYTFWTSYVAGIQLNMFIVFLPVFAFCFNLQMHLRKILKKTTVTEFLKTIIFDVVLGIGVLAYCFSSKSPSRAVLYMQAFNVSKATILCQLAHVSSRGFEPFRLSNLLQLCFLYGLSLSGANDGWAVVSALIATADFLSFAVVLVVKVAHISRVRVFTIGKPVKN